ncbi:MAG: hypothetical protein ABIN89_27310 [Chitinophagaceae bacterium]
MEKDFESGMFCKVALTGLFAGICATVGSLLYDLVFCYYSGFPYSAIVNISTIIFGITTTVFVAGVLYYYLINASRLGSAIFIVAFIFLTVFCLWRASFAERSLVYRETLEFRELLYGIIIITGISCFFLIPTLYKNEAFNKYVV